MSPAIPKIIGYGSIVLEGGFALSLVVLWRNHEVVPAIVILAVLLYLLVHQTHALLSSMHAETVIRLNQQRIIALPTLGSIFGLGSLSISLVAGPHGFVAPYGLLLHPLLLYVSRRKLVA